MYLLKNGYIIKDNKLIKKDIYIKDNLIVDKVDNPKVIDCTNLLISPGICDLHVHLREPGYESKETIKSGTLSAAKGGVTTLFAMPNLKPYPDNLKDLQYIIDLINKDALVNVYQYACITKGEAGKELADIKELSNYVLGFSDDGRGINDYKLLEEALLKIKEANKIICSHAEDYNYPADSNLNESEAVRKEIACVKNVGGAYHFCHMSTKESFKYIKEAKQEGLKISCEVTPHHLFLNKDMINDNPNFKMNPPLRSEEDRLACINALIDGTCEVIATDHAPHTKEDKNKPYAKALNGIIGLETLVPLVYTYLFKNEILPLNKFNDLLINNPRRIMGLDERSLEVGNVADIACFNIFEKHKYAENEILSKGKNSPFIGYELYGFCKYTFVDGKLVYGGE